MTKLTTLLLLTLAITFQASANDGSIPYINVTEIKTKLKNGDHIEFKGGEAFKLYEVLPRNYVYDLSRSITVTSNKRSVTIGCIAEPMDPNADQPTRNPAKTKCTVSVDAAFVPGEDGGDSSNWEPMCKSE